jgi:hypothetical protein
MRRTTRKKRRAQGNKHGTSSEHRWGVRGGAREYDESVAVHVSGCKEGRS